MSEQPTEQSAAQKEAEATQRIRDLLARGEGSQEFQNFAVGMKKAVSASKDQYKPQSKQAR
jgi:hypothetical protein